MGKMGLGYGSEYQLLRFLGHHRQKLNSIILKNTKINESLEYDMEWLDFPFPKDKNGSFDDEYTGINFLPESIQKKISKNWKKYWPQGKGIHNWDSILYLSPIIPDKGLNEHWILIEAKGQLKEGIENGSGATDPVSIKTINQAFELTKKRFNIKTQSDWLKKYYQFANRLAFVNFMLDNGIQCSLLYIYFINAWPGKPENIITKESWKELIHKEYEYLGINSNAKKYISEIFVEC